MTRASARRTAPTIAAFLTALLAPAGAFAQSAGTPVASAESRRETAGPNATPLSMIAR